jgi:hypothetical protein
VSDLAGVIATALKSIASATTSLAGIVELATQAEMDTGTDTARVPSVSVIGPKLNTLVHGTQTIDLDIETGTYDTDVTTSANRDVRARVWSNSNNGEGRYVIPPLPGRTGGNVVMRLWTTLGASGVAGQEVAWRLATAAIGIGDTLASALPNSQTVYQDVSGQSAHVITPFDITIDAALFDQTKRQAFILERLASSDARDDYNGASSFYLHAIDLIYTGWGPTASPSAPP